MIKKEKLIIQIKPILDTNTPPVDLTTVNDVLEFLSSKYEIDSIKIQLSERKKPSEFYFSLLSELCKTITGKVFVENYISTKENNSLKIDSFSAMNIIIDNKNKFTIIYNNEKKCFNDIESFKTIISYL